MAEYLPTTSSDYDRVIDRTEKAMDFLLNVESDTEDEETEQRIRWNHYSEERRHEESDQSNSTSEIKTEPKIKQEPLEGVLNKALTFTEKEKFRRSAMKSARRDDELDRQPSNHPDKKVTFRSSRRRTFAYSPTSNPYSSTLRSPYSTPPGMLPTPTDIRSSSSSGSDGMYNTSHREVGIDAGSLELNVSSLNIAKDSIKRETSSPIQTSREIGILNSSPQSKRVDEFIPPTKVVRNDSNYYSPSDSRNRDPPSVNERMTINKTEYTILKQVGEGGSGKVFQVFSHEYNDLFALKWIQLKRNEDKESIMNEIQLLKSLLCDAHIATYIEHEETPNAIYIIMELGEIDLATLIKSQHSEPWDINFIRFYWNQMLHAVLTIHRRNIVHTDLKPANFIVVKGRLKLIDFGIAKTISDDTTNIHREVQLGTINYMAPEALVNKNEGLDRPSLIKLGRASDVWSLGCILYQMVYGVTPFQHLQFTQKLYSIPNPDYNITFASETKCGDPPEKIKVPPVLIRLLQSCLERNPDMRPPLTELVIQSFVSL